MDSGIDENEQFSGIDKMVIRLVHRLIDFDDNLLINSGIDENGPILLINSGIGKMVIRLVQQFTHKLWYRRKWGNLLINSVIGDNGTIYS